MSNYRDEIAAEIIARIEAGTAPWMMPWDAGTIGTGPFNPITNKAYRGINDLWLGLRGRTDPRWMTYKQAAGIEAQVRKGEKSATIEYWQWTDRVALIDQDGKPVLDDEGKQRYRNVQLERPRVFYAKVFNAEQIDGLAPFIAPPAPPEPERHALAEKLLAESGVPVLHDQNNRAFYRIASDEIHLPPRNFFRSAEAYYETALHELGHATGHQSRLKREFGSFGGEVYAREELRAEIASYMLARDMGISFDPSNHAAYVESWLKALQDDKNEIFRAARDAEIIKTWVMEPERRPELERSAQGVASEQTISEPQEPAMSEPRQPRTYIAVPFAEKNEAKIAGAKWDRSAKSWYIPEGVDPAGLAKWVGKAAAPAEISPQEEFAQFLKANKLILSGAAEMDGQWHRVPTTTDKGKEKSGSYRGFLDGRPAGQAINGWNGQTLQWVSTGAGVTLSDEDRARIQAEAANVRAAREAERQAAAEKVARTAYGVWANLPDEASPENSPYLAAKGVKGHGVKVNGDGHVIIPCRDASGRLWNIQTVTPEAKLFLKDGRKQGTFHVLEVTGKGTLDTLLPLKQGAIIIAEGYATAATIFEETGRPVISAFDCHNLKPVAEAVRAKFPDRLILIAADNDHARVNEAGMPENIGVIKAEEAAKAVGGKMVAPSFTADEQAQKLTDFNDLKQSRGAGWVRRAIEGALSKAQGQERGIA